jgi:hypothetical protein
MRTSVIHFEVRARQRFASLAVQCALHARSGREAAQIDQVIAAVDDAALTISEAHAALAALQTDQQRAAA